MVIHYEQYYKKLSGCYLGKVIGGTLGQPYEGKLGPHNLSYYDPIPTAMIANDDVDLQVVWVECIKRHGFPVNRKHLVDFWKHIRFGPDEYGIAIHNIRDGLSAPLSGWYNNKFYAGMGAAIRSELWAALAPGNPDLAVAMAREDACVDHYSDGVDASLFITAIESSAYFLSDIDELISVGLSYIPADSRLANGIKDTMAWWGQDGNCLAVRQKILDKYGVLNWTDVTINLCFIVLAWLAGGGDFGKSICLATSMGYDADCTAATLGSILGIIDPDSIEEKWKTPIGNRVILSPPVIGIFGAKTLEDLCLQIAVLAKNAETYYHSPVEILHFPNLPEISGKTAKPWTDHPELVMLSQEYCLRDSLIALSPVIINLTYPPSVAIRYNEWSSFSATISNPTNESLHIHLTLSVSDGFQIEPGEFQFQLAAYEQTVIEFQILSQTIDKKSLTCLNFHLTINHIAYLLTAGLPTAYPWLHKAASHPAEQCPSIALFQDASPHQVDSFFQPVASGEHYYAINVKSVMRRQVALVCQGTRSLKMWLNGTLLWTYESDRYVPAVHRGSSVLGNLKYGWNEIIIFVEDGDPGELFFAIGSPIDWIWYNDLEWRRPLVEEHST